MAAELQLPSTKFNITYRRSCEVLQFAELIAQAAEHIRQRLFNSFQGQRKLNAARHPAGKKFRFGLAQALGYKHAINGAAALNQRPCRKRSFIHLCYDSK